MEAAAAKLLYGSLEIRSTLGDANRLTEAHQVAREIVAFIESSRITNSPSTMDGT
jgi:hypothetical protein